MGKYEHCVLCGEMSCGLHRVFSNNRQTNLGKKGGGGKGALEYHSVKHSVVPQRSPV